MSIRKEFEKLEDVKQGLRHCHYNESTNDYHADVTHEETHEWHTQFVNGAWYTFQEQQKKKDLAISKIKAFEKNTSADQVLFLNDLLIELKGMLK